MWHYADCHLCWTKSWLILLPPPPPPLLCFCLTSEFSVVTILEVSLGYLNDCWSEIYAFLIPYQQHWKISVSCWSCLLVTQPRLSVFCCDDAAVTSWQRRQFWSLCRHTSVCVAEMISVHHVMLSSLHCARRRCHRTMHCMSWLSVQTLEVSYWKSQKWWPSQRLLSTHVRSVCI